MKKNNYSIFHNKKTRQSNLVFFIKISNYYFLEKYAIAYQIALSPTTM